MKLNIIKLFVIYFQIKLFTNQIMKTKNRKSNQIKIP